MISIKKINNEKVKPLKLPTIDADKINYTIDIYVKTTHYNQIQILANKCKDETKLEEFNTLANKAEKAFAKKEYKEILNGLEVKEVYVESLPNIPTQTIINKLLQNVFLIH